MVTTIFDYFLSVLKKAKHRVVENMHSGTADALGLSRAILCNGEFRSGVRYSGTSFRGMRCP
jgi:hypothetical protein